MTLTWSDFEPRVRALLDAPPSAAEVPAWLERRDALERDVGETWAALSRAKDEDTADVAAKEAFLAFVRETLPRLQEAQDALDRTLHAVGGYEPPPDLRVAWSDIGDRIATFHPDNVPLITREQELEQRYAELTGAVRVELDGERITVTQARAKLVEPDRDLRERAWRATEGALDEVRPRLDELFLELVRLRQRIARTAGFRDYVDYTWRARHRREYTPADARALHGSVAAEVVPRVEERTRARARDLGLERVRPWDMAVDPGGEPLRPFADVAELEEGLQRMFTALDPELGERFGRLRGGWMDLAPRDNKVPGLGYQNYFPRSRMPYIYMSAVGTDDDLVTMRHEAGHAFHSMLTDERWPLHMHDYNRPEAAELASEAMELLTLPYLERSRGGFYTADEARRSRRSLLDRILGLWVRCCAVDAVQHWIYTQDEEALTAESIDAAWLRITDELATGVDWSGLESSRAKGWQVIHVFQYPFYFLEYALAYMGAVQVWQRASDDHGAALAAYKRALSLGGTVPLDELYEAAGARFAFDRETVRRLAEVVSGAFER